MKILGLMVRFFIVISLFTVLLSCGSKKNDDKKSDKKDDKKTERTRDLKNPGSDSSALGWYDISNESPNIIELPGDLREISGITFTDDERLFAHGDEDGDVFQVDYITGKIMKRFSLGSLMV